MKCPNVEEWKAKGKTILVNGFEIFYIDEGTSNEVICILHGYPSCSYDYYRVLPLLTSKYRVIVHDHLGFGLSGRPLNYSYSLIEQADVALAFWETLGLDNIHLLAHDYGTSVATEIIARINMGYEPVKLKNIILGNGSMLIEKAKLLLIQRLLRSPTFGPLVVQLTTEWVFKMNMSKVWYDKSKVNLKEFEILYRLLWDTPESKKTFPIVSRYLDERRKFWHRWIGALCETQRKIILIWADKDPVAIIEMAYDLQDKIPNNELFVLKDIGHYPMLEAPEIYANHVSKALG